MLLYLPFILWSGLVLRIYDCHSTRPAFHRDDRTDSLD
jgi:hypothetical protein